MSARVLIGGIKYLADQVGRIDAAIEPGDRPIYVFGGTHARKADPIGPYWVYNIEPLQAPGKLTGPYRELLDGAERVFDYSEPNTELYPRGEFRPMALGEVAEPPDPRDCDIDVLFYGYLSPRRRKLTDALDAVVVDGEHGDALQQLHQRAKVVLCVNAYDDLNANPLRAFPALEHGARLVVEETQEQWFNDAVAPHAAVVPYGEIVDESLRILEAL